jgi:hypothetical protein
MFREKKRISGVKEKKSRTAGGRENEVCLV